MWFAKWFGGASEVEGEDDEPARHAPPPSIRPAAPQVAKRSGAASAGRPASGTGFDPYNSGAFERRNAWERIKRR